MLVWVLFSAWLTALQTERHMKQPWEHTGCICYPDTAGDLAHYITQSPKRTTTGEVPISVKWCGMFDSSEERACSLLWITQNN